MARDLHEQPEHCRLLLGFRRAQQSAAMARTVGRIMLETGASLPAPSASMAEPGDLRGIPVIGRGVGGAIGGTKPGAGRSFEAWSPPQAFPEAAESLEA